MEDWLGAFISYISLALDTVACVSYCTDSSKADPQGNTLPSRRHSAGIRRVLPSPHTLLCPLWSSLLALCDNRISCVLTSLDYATQQVKCCPELPMVCRNRTLPLPLFPLDTVLGTDLHQCPLTHRLHLLTKGLSDRVEPSQNWPIP